MLLCAHSNNIRFTGVSVVAFVVVGGRLLFILVYSCLLCVVWAVVVGLLRSTDWVFVGIGKGGGGGGGEHTQKNREKKKNTNTNHEPNERGEITALAPSRCWKYAGELFQGSANSIHILANTHTRTHTHVNTHNTMQLRPLNLDTLQRLPFCNATIAYFGNVSTGVHHFVEV